MKTRNFPFLYFLILLLAFVLALIFWVIIIRDSKPKREIPSINTFHLPKNEAKKWKQPNISGELGQIVPIDTSKIIIDSSSHRRILSNLVNIALKDSTYSITEFAKNLKEVYRSDEYKIIYIDTIISRLQLQLPVEARARFKTEVKAKLNQYQLLVWDEVLFNQSRQFNDPLLNDTKANWYLKAANIDKAWEKSTGDKDIVIAVIDNGFDLAHPELKGKAVRPYNVIDKSVDVSPSTVNHGTHISSTIVANGNNGQGLVGICPDCTFMPVKVQDKNGIISSSYVIDAILYAIKNKASVINLSIGIQFPDGLNVPLASQMEFMNSGAKDEEAFWGELFGYADERNVTCVIAAGNNNMLTGFDPFQRIWGTIKVGAVDKRIQKASFSNFGEKTTVFAPGTNIYGAKPGNGYEMLDGTSMAAPIVSGFIGLIKSKHKNISNPEILKKIHSNSIGKNNMRFLNIVANID